MANAVPAKRPHNMSTTCCFANLPGDFISDVIDGLWCTTQSKGSKDWKPICSCNEGYYCTGPGCFLDMNVASCHGKSCLVNGWGFPAAQVASGIWPFQTQTECVPQKSDTESSSGGWWSKMVGFDTVFKMGAEAV